MTKYVLNSGSISRYKDKSMLFYDEVFKGFKGDVKVLLCYFAINSSRWESSFEEDKIKISSLLPRYIKAKFEMATIDEFTNQCNTSDVIYIKGGEDDMILNALNQYKVPNILEGKVVATNSASSHALSSYFWSCDSRSLRNGLDILPIKFIAHFNSDYGSDDERGSIDWNKAYHQLLHYNSEDMPLYALNEGDFVTIYS